MNLTARAAPGGHTPVQVAAATAAGVAYIDTQQNADGSFGTTAPEAETGAALQAYGVLSNRNFASLPAGYQTHVKKAITWLLSQQDSSAPSGGGPGGSWSLESATYDTGLALSGLSAFQTVDAGIPGALANGRAYLANSFQAPPLETCSSADPPDTTASFCGGWNYDAGVGRSDESNTGFALTGLQLSGGVPPAIASVNIGWQHHIQEISSNSLASRNDGGGDYQPGETGSFSSNANDTGSMLFGLGFDGVSAADPHVQAGLKLGNDILDVYELAAPASRTMVYHSGMTEDGACTPGAACDWNLGTGEGGFHYSLFALTKGMGEFIPPSLTDATNWYAKVADLLLNEQGTDGSWPPDLRDDASQVFATALSVSALGLVAVPPPPTTTTTSTTSTTTTVPGATTTTSTTVAGATTTSTTVAGATTTSTTVAGATTTSTTVASGTTTTSTTVAGATTTSTTVSQIADLALTGKNFSILLALASVLLLLGIGGARVGRGRR